MKELVKRNKQPVFEPCVKDSPVCTTKEMPRAEYTHTFVDGFVKYMQYSRKLGFDETPDYNWLRGLFVEVLREIGEEDDGIFDWALLNDGKGWQSVVREKKRTSRKLLLPPPLPSHHQSQQREGFRQIKQESSNAHQTLQDSSRHHRAHYNSLSNIKADDDSSHSNASRTIWAKLKSLLTCGIF
jgi:hypothetical protein